MIPTSLTTHNVQYRSIFSPKSEFNVLSETERRKVSLKDLQKICKMFGDPLDMVSSLPNGTHSVIYPFYTVEGHYVIKASLAPTNYNLHVAEFATKEVSDIGLSAPEILLTDTSRYLVPFDFQVQAESKGRPIDFDVSEPIICDRLKEVAHRLSRVHQIHMAGYGHIDPTALYISDLRPARGMFETWSEFLLTRLNEHIEYCEQIGAINEMEVGQIQAIMRILPSLDDTFTPALLHNDLNPKNILIDKDDFVFLDWDDAIVGDPIFDLANMCTFHMPERFKSIWSGYFGNKPNKLEHRFWLYYLRIVLSRTVHRHRYGIQDNPKYPPASRRIQLALENLAG